LILLMKQTEGMVPLDGAPSLQKARSWLTPAAGTYLTAPFQLRNATSWHKRHGRASGG
jgi:hypothetical protein